MSLLAPQSASSEEQPLNAGGVVAEVATEVELKPVGGSVADVRRGILRARKHGDNAEDGENAEVRLLLTYLVSFSMYACVTTLRYQVPVLHVSL